MLGFSRAQLSNAVDSVLKTLRHAYRRSYLRREIRACGNCRSALTRDQRAQAKAYWRKYTKHFSPLWHELFAARTGRFDVRYIPADLMYTEIEGYLNDWASAKGIDNKCNYAMYFPEVRQPQTAFTRQRGIYRDADYDIISRAQALENCRKMGDVALKVAVDSGRGSGLRFWRGQDGAETLDRFVDELKGDIVAQAFIAQHPELAAINPTSVNVIRVMTLAASSGVRLVSAYLQTGRDNTRQSQVSKGGCIVGIEPDGTCRKQAFDSNYHPLTVHPNGLVFEGFAVPGYDKVVLAAKRMHRKMGDFRIISWDFAVSPEGEPVFIEMNLNYGGIVYHQLSGGPLFAEDTDALLDEVYGKQG
ncbi:MAG: hypothetical protein FWE69_04685 [Clostridiales bacterium]|nr:hypothetical protein [Clostridiales bacterium]